LGHCGFPAGFELTYISTNKQPRDDDKIPGRRAFGREGGDPEEDRCRGWEQGSVGKALPNPETFELGKEEPPIAADGSAEAGPVLSLPKKWNRQRRIIKVVLGIQRAVEPPQSKAPSAQRFASIAST
jgi:hypothetical protein